MQADTFASWLRRFAQGIRHAPFFRQLTPLWDLLRRPYRALLKWGSRGRGVPVSVAGFSMILAPEFASNSWESIERDSYAAFRKLVTPHAVVYDVGAHIGTYTILACRADGARVVSFEPTDETRSFLEQHLRWNGCLDQVIVRPVVLGEAPGNATLYARSLEGRNSLVPTEGFDQRVIPMSAIDAEVSSSGIVPTIIKVDVEGGEFAVLKGATGTLETYGPTLFLSLHPDALAQLNQTPEEIIHWLAERGYEVEILGRDHEIHCIFRKGGRIS